MDTTKGLILAECSLCNQGTMKNTPITTRSHVETLHGAVLRTDMALMNNLSLGGATYFVTFIDEALGYVKAFHMKTKGEATKVLKHHVRWIAPQK